MIFTNVSWNEREGGKEKSAELHEVAVTMFGHREKNEAYMNTSIQKRII